MSGPFGSTPHNLFNTTSSDFYNGVINQSLRFDATGYLTRNTGQAGNVNVYTTSFWVKRGNLTSNQYIFSAGPWDGGNNFEGIRFVNDDTLRAILTVGNSTVANFTTNAKFRDVNSWYHIVWQRNGQAYKLYVNGTNEDQNLSLNITTNSNNSDFFIKNPSLLDKLEFPSASNDKTSRIV